MSEEARASATPAKGSRGCLRGVLMGCGTVVLILALFAVGAYVVWDRWVEPRVHQLEGMGEALVPESVRAVAKSKEGQVRRTGSDRPEDLPAQIWVPPGASRQAVRVAPNGESPEEALAVLRFDAPARAPSVARLKKELGRKGWKPAGKHAGEAGTEVLFRRGRERLSVLLEERAGATWVWIRWRARPAEEKGS